jgi:hypothetical protein
LKKLYNLLSSLLIPSSLLCSELLLDTKNEILDNSEKRIELNQDKTSIEWINPIKLKYKHNYDQNSSSKALNLSIDQPIFKSGGILYTIKYSNISANVNRLENAKRKIELEREVFTTVLNLRKNALLLRKQSLLINSALIDINRKYEQVSQGVLDISFLNRSILEKNDYENGLIDLEISKESLHSNLRKVSNMEFHRVKIPKISLDRDNYLSKNLNIKIYVQQIEQSRELELIQETEFLPTISLYGNYSKYLQNDSPIASINESSNRSFNYGLELTIPFDIKKDMTNELAKVETKESEIKLQESINEELLLFTEVVDKIDKLNRKIAVTKNSINLYNNLIKDTKESIEAGLQTEDELTTLINSKELKKLEIDIFNIEKDIEKIKIYYY